MEKIAEGDTKYWWVEFTGETEPPRPRGGGGGLWTSVSFQSLGLERWMQTGRTETIE